LVNLRRIQVLRRESTGRLAASIEGYGEVEFSRRQAKALRSRFVI
jgi:DNA-binding LytR/AlgR family response regulator